jgi:hypothetical protein
MPTGKPTLVSIAFAVGLITFGAVTVFIPESGWKGFHLMFVLRSTSHGGVPWCGVCFSPQGIRIRAGRRAPRLVGWAARPFNVAVYSDLTVGEPCL